MARAVPGGPLCRRTCGGGRAGSLLPSFTQLRRLRGHRSGASGNRLHLDAANLGDDRDRGNWPRYKRSFYVDWPVQNKHQFRALPACDLLVDITAPENPSFIPAADLLEAFRDAGQRPFRVRSLFMPGIWGGTRLREIVPDLPQEWPNCAWGFELVGP